MGAGVSGPRIDAQVSKGPVIYSRPFHWPSETGAGGRGGWGHRREVAFLGRVRGALFVLSQASTTGQRAWGWGHRGYRPDFCLCVLDGFGWVVKGGVEKKMGEGGVG